jgi:DNA-binding NtrC family response regulator
MISGHGTIETAVQAIQQGAYDFIEKPFKSDRLLLVVSRALEAARLQRENSELRLRAGPRPRSSASPRPSPSCARRSSGWRRPDRAC